MRRLLWIAALVAALAFVWTLGTRDATVNFSGDLAPDLQTIVGRTVADAAFTTDFSGAKITVISVTDWDKLAFVPGAIEACGDDCRNSGPNLLVRVINVTISGVRKQVFLNVASFLEDTDANVFSLSDHGIACLEQGLAIELTSLSGGDWPADCLKKESAITRWKPGLF